MTVIGQNPYGDAGGMAPNWDNLKTGVNTAYQNAITRLHLKNNDLLQQYGFNQNDTLDQQFANPLASGNATFDPNSLGINTANPYGQYQQMLGREGQAIQGLMHNATARGLGHFGLGAQGVSQAHTAADMEQGNFFNNVYSTLAGDYGTAADTKSQTAGQLAGIDQAHGNFDQWAKTHLVSEGGLIPDSGPGSPGYKAPPPPPNPAIIKSKANDNISKFWASFQGSKNGNQMASTLGNMRDAIRQYGKQYGKDANYQKQLALYNAGLHRAGLKGSKWTI